MFLKFRVIDGKYIVRISRDVVKHVYKVVPFRFVKVRIDIVQVVQTVQIGLQKFHFTEPGSNLAFVLKNIAHNFYKMPKGHVIAFYKTKESKNFT